MNNVRAVLRAAVRDRVIAHDPSDSVTLPRLRRSGAGDDSCPRTTRSARSSAPRTRRSASPWRSAAFAGLRLGEAAGPAGWRRRLPAPLVLLVRRQVQRGRRAGAVEVRPRSTASERSVFLPDELLELLSRGRRRASTGDRPVPRGCSEATPGSAAPPEHGRPPVAARLCVRAGRDQRGRCTTSATSTRQRTDRRRLRRGDRPAGPRARQSVRRP